METETTPVPFVEIGQSIAAIRTNNGLTQTALTKALAHVGGMSQGRISRLERGHWMPNAGQFEHLIQALKCNQKQAGELRHLAICAVRRLVDA